MPMFVEMLRNIFCSVGAAGLAMEWWNYSAKQLQNSCYGHSCFLLLFIANLMTRIKLNALK